MIMDPQQRFFLECAWEALEQAGYSSGSDQKIIGIYGGVGHNNYLRFNVLAKEEHSDAFQDYELGIANEKDFLTTRVAYKLNLRGPSVTIQTACSTSLVAVHHACQSLLSYQCDLALAGGVSIRLPQIQGYLYQTGWISSPDGHCRAFDAKAAGTVFGSGAGVVALKRLAEAVADGDTIYAVIKGSAINNDGSLKIGYTAPSVTGQAEVIAMALAVAGIAPETVGYIETHGTGTQLGDPIEIEALSRVFHQCAGKNGFCAIGSVKTNIGHVDTAAGVAGLIKTVLALKYKQIPPSLNFEKPNSAINFATSPFYVNAQLVDWKSDDLPRRAGVSSFGVGGTNAHVLLEEAPVAESTGKSRPWQLLLLSARTETALDAMTVTFVKHLRDHSDLSLADAAFTLQIGRKIFRHRRMVVCRDMDDAIETLEKREPQRVFAAAQEHHDRPVAFMFTGQGSQYAGMAQGLYEAEPTFRAQVDACCELLKPNLGQDLREVLYPHGSKVESQLSGRNQTLDQTAITQPALFVIEYALAKLWMKWGIEPQAMIGHSVGEYTAACLAGVFALEDALALVAARGQLMQQIPGGAMLSVALAEDRVRPWLNAELSLAAVNAPELCVVAGTAEAVDALKSRLGDQGVACHRLQTSHAFHSAMMEPILEPFRQKVEKIKLHAPVIPYISNVTGTWITEAEVTDPSYWTRHLRHTVRFGEGLRELMKEQNFLPLEVGPGQTLVNLARRNLNGRHNSALLPSLRQAQTNKSDVEFILETLGRLWLAGVPVKWEGFYAHERRRRVPLPTYPFERQRYWMEAQKQPHSDSAQSRPVHKMSDIADWFYVPSWKQTPPLAAKVRNEPLRCLVFADVAALGRRFATWLERRNHVVTVIAGGHFAKLDERRYVVHPGRLEDYEALLDALGASNFTPDHIVHLWTLSQDELKGPRLEALEASQELGFYSLLYLAQAVGRRPAMSLKLTVVSNDLFDVTGDEILRPENATLLGPCKTIPQEYPEAACRLIDVDTSWIATAREPELMDRLFAEVVSDATDAAVAYRGRHRWVRTFDPVHLKAAENQSQRIREGGVYLITGGLGGIGLVLAEYLAQTARAKLVLVGRSRFPGRDDWEQWLASHSEGDPVSYRIRKVRAIETLGAEALIIAANVANLEQMKAVMRLATERFGAVNGVIHAAGIAGGGVIQLKDRDAVARVLSSKLKGTLVLDELLRDTRLDFLVLCSSLFALTNRAGQVDYCGANAFLDAYAHDKSSRGDSFAVSINWDAWEEVGMALDNRLPSPADRIPPRSRRTEINHPLIDRLIIETPNRLIYRTDFRANKHWVLNEHRIFGTPTLPGTAYLEMAVAAFKRSFEQERVEITDVYFLTPLAVGEDEEKEVFTILERDGAGCDFRIISKASAIGTGPSVWREHARGKIAELTQPAAAMTIARQVLDGFVRVTTPVHKNEQTIDRANRVYWGPRWRCVKALSGGKSESFAHLDLSEDFCSDLERLQLHPSLLDVATSLGARNASEDDYLPFSYGRLDIYGPLPRNVYSYVKLDESGSTGSEIIKFDALITDQNGQTLVQIKGLSLKRINEGSSLLDGIVDRERDPRPDNARLSDAEAEFYESLLEVERQGGMEPQGILPGEGVEVFRRILTFGAVPQVAVSVTDLHSVLDRRQPAALVSSAEQTSRPSSISSRHARPKLQSTYATPQNDSERILADIWQEVFGIDRVGVNDNFFELGGDSVIAIQVIAKANKAGYRIAANDIFQRQTITELASVGRTGRNLPPEQEVTTDTAGQFASSPYDDFGWTQEDRDQINRALRHL